MATDTVMQWIWATIVVLVFTGAACVWVTWTVAIWHDQLRRRSPICRDPQGRCYVPRRRL